jgi:hypothetical protein
MKAMPKNIASSKATAANSVQSTDQALETESNLIMVDDLYYDASMLPEEIRALLKDLLRFNQEFEELQYKLRKVQAAQQTYYETIKSELIAKKVQPYRKD